MKKIINKIDDVIEEATENKFNYFLLAVVVFPFYVFIAFYSLAFIGIKRMYNFLKP